MNRISRLIFKGILEINEASFGFYLFAVVVYTTLKQYWPDIVSFIEIPLGNLFLFLLVSAVLKLVSHIQDITNFFLRIQRFLMSYEIQLTLPQKKTVKIVKAPSLRINNLNRAIFRKCNQLTRAVISRIPLKRLRSGALFAVDGTIFLLKLVLKGVVDFMLIMRNIIMYVANFLYRRFVLTVLVLIRWSLSAVGLIERKWIRGRTPLQLFPIVVGYLLPLSIILYLILIYLDEIGIVNENITGWLILILIITFLLCLLWIISLKPVEGDFGQLANDEDVSRFFVVRLAAISTIAGLLIYHYTDAVLFLRWAVSVFGAILIFSSIILHYAKQQ